MEAIYNLIQIKENLHHFSSYAMCVQQKVVGYLSKYFSLSTIFLLYLIVFKLILVFYHVKYIIAAISH